MIGRRVIYYILVFKSMFKIKGKDLKEKKKGNGKDLKEKKKGNGKDLFYLSFK